MSVNLITITGSAQELRDLALTPPDDLDLHEESARRLSTGSYVVAGYASNEAMAALTAIGLVVSVVMDEGELDARWSSLLAADDGVPPQPPIV